MRKGTKIVLVIVVILVVLQFFRPANNASQADPVNDIAAGYDVPMDVLMILNDACYDCHSNYSTYPWYHNIQPVGAWMDHHIKEAKRHLNFSEFATYSAKDAAHAFHEMSEMMEEHAMPISSYKLLHKKGRLTDEQYTRVEQWAKKMEAQF